MDSVSESLPDPETKTFYENLPFHGIQTPPNKVSEKKIVSTNFINQIKFCLYNIWSFFFLYYRSNACTLECSTILLRVHWCILCLKNNTRIIKIHMTFTYMTDMTKQCEIVAVFQSRLCVNIVQLNY